MLPFGSKSQVKVLEQQDNLAAALLHEKRHWWTDSAPEGQKSAKIRHFFGKVVRKWGPVADRGQAAPASPSPHAGGSHPVGTRLTPPPNSNHRHFHRFPSPAAAPKGPAFGRLEKSGRRPSAFGRRPPAGRRPACGWPGFSSRPKAGPFGAAAGDGKR